MDSTKHLSPEAAAILTGSDADRIKFILSERFVCYQKARDIIDHVCFLAFQPPQTRVWGLGIVAPPGSGKTMLAHALVRSLVRLESERSEERRATLPAVMISITGVRDARMLDTRILHAMGNHSAIRKNMRVAEREQLVMRSLRDARVRVLIIDEIQDVLTSTEKQQRFALDQVKLIMNTVRVPVVVLGIPGAMGAMRVDPHLSERFDWEELPEWKANDDTRALLDSLEHELPLKEPSKLASVDLTRFISEKANGTLARIVRLVGRAAVYAIQDGTERITKVTLEKACARVPVVTSQLLAEQVSP